MATDSDIIHRVILGQCYREATKSPDPSTQIGACIVSNDYILAKTMSHNGPTEGWSMAEHEWTDKSLKYQLVEHAERRAIYKACRNGLTLQGRTMYSTWAACADCARAIVESGITRLVRHYPPVDDATERWLQSVQIGDSIMKANGVEIIDVHGPIPEGFKILRGGGWFDPSV